MERLTWHNGEYWTQVQTQKVGTTKVGYKAICAKLAAYEDTGLGPEEVATILRRTAEHDKAMEEGRLVELPCKKGAKLFVITPTSTTVIEETKCNRVSIDGSGVAHLFARCVYDDWGGAYYEFKTPDFGKTVFLTRKEAEAALHGGGEGG